jgi:hypothetical protein
LVTAKRPRPALLSAAPYRSAVEISSKKQEPPVRGALGLS